MIRPSILAIAAAVTVAVPAHAAQSIDLSGYATHDLRTYSGGTNYPVGGTTLNIGGVDFTLSTLHGQADTTGVIQTDFGFSSFDIPLYGAVANTAYLIINSSFGLLPLKNGEVWISDINGNTQTFDLMEGTNVRDHYFNDTFIQTVSSPNFIGSAEFGNVGGDQVRLDAYKFALPGNFGPLLNLEFRGVDASGASGEPFLAAITLDNLRAGPVPEPTTWALMIGGFGMVGTSMRYRRRKTSISFG